MTIWDLEWDRQNFLSFWTVFLPFYSPENPKSQDFEKMKKTAGDIILHKCTKNHDHMLHCSWDTLRDGCNSYFLFWASFCPFIPPTTKKIKICKKWKKREEISFYTCVPKIMITWCTVPEIWCAMDGQTDGQTDGKSDIHRRVPHLKTILKDFFFSIRLHIFFMSSTTKIDILSFFEGHNPPTISDPLLTSTSPISAKNFLVTPPLQTIDFTSAFFFSFNLKSEQKQLILDILIFTCPNFFFWIFIFLNKLLIWS